MSNYTLGLDVSRWQGTMDWDKAKAAGVRFAMLKCSEGASYTDPKFARNYEECRRLGILAGAYHFVRANVKAGTQAKYIVETIGSRQLDLGIALDCETVDGMGARSITDCILTLSAKLEAHYGVRPMIYTSQSFGNAYLLADARWQEHKLWVANWTTADKPAMPKHWDEWHIWQYAMQPTAGPQYGAQSEGIDLNRMVAPVLPPPEPPPVADSVTASVVVNGVTYSGVLTRI